MSDSRYGVLLLQMGGPTDLDDIEPFLAALLSDPLVMGIPLSPLRRMIAKRIARKRAPLIRPRYAALGGASPIHKETRSQAEGLAKLLGCPVAYAMRYSVPHADKAIRDLIAQQVTRLVLLPLYPQFSRATNESSLTDALAAAQELGVPCTIVRSFPDDAAYLDAQAALIRHALDGLHDPLVIFSAHGLPVRAVKAGDPYPDEIAKTVAGLTARLPENIRTTLAFQSRLGPVRWLEPYLDATVREAGQRGEKELVLIPISFVSEHIETRYELDVEIRDEALAHGVERFVRVPTLSNDAAFLTALAGLVRSALNEGQTT